MLGVKILSVVLLLVWYGAMLLALVFAVRESRWQFSLRALLMTTTIVAFLLGLAATLYQAVN
jgi:hypothetical protein